MKKTTIPFYKKSGTYIAIAMICGLYFLGLGIDQHQSKITSRASWSTFNIILGCLLFSGGFLSLIFKIKFKNEKK